MVTGGANYVCPGGARMITGGKGLVPDGYT